jgi:hypothetical protein
MAQLTAIEFMPNRDYVLIAEAAANGKRTAITALNCKNVDDLQI